jgi:NAD+ kinase
MCRIAARSTPGVGVFDYEIRHQFRGETYHLVKKLLGEEVARVRCDFSLIVGQDNADGLASWTNSQGLERLLPFLVVPRAGSPPPRASAWYLRPPHRYLEGADGVFATSSTEVRRRLKAGEPADDLLPAEVLEYARAHGLYRESPPPPGSPAAPRSRRVAIFAAAFEPPGRFHRDAVEGLLADGFDRVVVCPTVLGGAVAEHAPGVHRAALAALAFRDLEGVEVDLTELDEGRSLQPASLEARHGDGGEVWHVVAADPDQSLREKIQGRWEDGPKHWRTLRFIVLQPAGEDRPAEDLPTTYRLLPVCAGTIPRQLRMRIYAGDDWDGLVAPEVARYIRRLGLFRPGGRGHATPMTLDRPRLRIVFDERNPRAAEVAARYARYASDAPDLILAIGGDGTMLRAVREHWRHRAPFLGVNAGHLGFLMNEALPADLDGLELMAHAMPMLRVDATSPDGRVATGVAYGDAWVERGDGQAAWLRLDIDGQTRVRKVVGDGMLVATASGSSAYARAMGATPLPLNTTALTLAGSNVFRPRFWRPMSLPGDSVITLASLDRSGKRPVRAFLDGTPLGVVDSVTVRRSAVAGVELLFTRAFAPSDKLLRSLFPPAEDET